MPNKIESSESVCRTLWQTPAQELAARCQNTQPDASHEPFCFELFRRAIAKGCTLAWQYLYHQYYRLVRYWIGKLPVPKTDSVDDLVQEALAAFWRSYTPDKLDRAKGLGSILTYLKSCAKSAVDQARRRARRLAVEEEWNEHLVNTHLSAPPPEIAVLRRMAADDLWAAVESHCHDKRDHLVARFVFQAGLKPRQIAGQYPHLFPDVSDVYRVKRNLINRLRRSPTIQHMCENRLHERSIE